MVGDDVVDLADPEARADALHPRFDARVFAPAERAALAASADPGVDRPLSLGDVAITSVPSDPAFSRAPKRANARPDRSGEISLRRIATFCCS